MVEDGFHEVPIWCPPGGGGTREARSIVVESMFEHSNARYRLLVSTRFGGDRGQLDRRRARGVLNPCARQLKARTGSFLRGKLISGYGLFSSY